MNRISERLAHPFFFYCDGDHRDIHSFPTRRSSDLAAALCQGGEFIFVLLGFAVGARVLPDGKPQQHEEDRKSTRLNSSHVEISYAVFCLKKKKKENKTTHCGRSGTDTICWFMYLEV